MSQGRGRLVTIESLIGLWHESHHTVTLPHFRQK